MRCRGCGSDLHGNGECWACGLSAAAPKQGGVAKRCTWVTGDRRCQLMATIFELHASEGRCEWHYRKQSALEAQDKQFFDDYWAFIERDYPHHPWLLVGREAIWQRSLGHWADAEKRAVEIPF